MTSENLTLVQKTLLGMISRELFGADFETQADTDWSEVYSESLSQAVSAIAFNDIDKYSIDDQLKNDIQKRIIRTIAVNIKIHSNHRFLHKFLTDNDIPYCILKGSASAYYYPNSILRAMGDVDFLVPKEYVDKTMTLLEKDGFEKSEEDHICHIVFKKNDIHLEMHFEPAGMPSDKRIRETITGYLSDIYDNTEFVDEDGMYFMKPSHFHHGLIIIMHTYHHMLSEGIGLRHLCDFAVFVNSFSNDEFESLFKEKLSEIGLWKFTQIMAATACRHLNMPYKEWMGEQSDELCRQIIIDIFNGGNFGRKDKDRVSQGKIISDRGKNGIGSSAFSSFTHSYNELAAKKYKIFRKSKLIYKTGWIFMTIRYVYRLLTGKGKWYNYSKLKSDADDRRNIYSQFELFKKDEE